MNDSETMEPEACRVMARECYEMAQDAPEPDLRRQLLDLAIRWHELAHMIESGRADRKLH
jgi:hypothetical protein